jgi:feruloyl esterase
VAAAGKIYSGPMTSKGEKLYYGAMPGSEKGPIFFGAAYSTEFFRYLAFMPEAGPRWNAKDFDFDTDFRRAGVMAPFYDANNPDLRNFKAAGGKLMIVHGWHDSGSPMPLDTVDYYETVERTMGGRTSTQDFVRLFMMPGRAHCGGGPGANAFDYLGYLEAWVERGHAPDVMIGAHVESEDPADFIREPKDPREIKFTRPVYPYPYQTRYSGKGDPNDYRNFEPLQPVSQ